MPFVKLDTGILESTLWIDRALRDVFITALLMATPIEFSEIQVTYHVDSLQMADFVVPPGRYGFVAAAGQGIIRRALVEHSEGMDALRKLAGVDLESRSPEHEGRRMVRVSGGFVILNYTKYRDKDHTSAERQARYRERRKGSNAVTVTSVTQADADADADKSTPAPNGKFTVSEAASVYCQTFLVSGEKRLAEVRDAIELALKNWPKETPQTISEEMIRRRFEYVKLPAKGFTFDPVPFITSGAWRNPDGWKKTKATDREAAVGARY